MSWLNWRATPSIVLMTHSTYIARCFLLLFLFQIIFGCASYHHDPARPTGIFLSDMTNLNERELTQSEADRLRELINLSIAFDNFIYPSGDPQLNAPSPNPNVRYHIYSETFGHNGYYFLKDGTPLHGRLTEDEIEHLSQFIKRIANRNRRQFLNR